MVCKLFSWMCPTFYLCFQIFNFFQQLPFYCRSVVYIIARGFSDVPNRTRTLVPSEELLFVFPAISLMSSPSKSIKGAATELLSILEKFLVTLSMTTKDEVVKERGFHFPSISTPGSIVVKLLEKLRFQVSFIICLEYFPLYNLKWSPKPAEIGFLLEMVTDIW